MIKEAKQLHNDECVYNMLCDYRKKFPKALAPKRLCLTFASGILIVVTSNHSNCSIIIILLLYIILYVLLHLGNAFQTEVDSYLRAGFHKGVPPLFVDLRSLYKNKHKVQIIESLLESYVNNLTKFNSFDSEGIVLFFLINKTTIFSLFVFKIKT